MHSAPRHLGHELASPACPNVRRGLLFTEVPRREILRTSPVVHSRNFARKVFLEVAPFS